ncbi:Trk system potassium transporter TrkA [Neglectibacter caecimuris]|uniref:Trk system potassium transporter TrkA n=1 Tax=Neglectibacter caecimuris TaxID=3093658 RepID=UPI002AC9E393|nr:Trk system potassium transporter TrkA [Neglectibacter sp. M00184]
MKIVIVGDGKVGSALTVQLSREGHDVVVIDNNKMVLEEMQQSWDVSVVHGNGATLKIQKMANVDNSDLLIAATSADETNILCCILARKLGCKHTIARVRNPDYYHQLFLLKEELGVSLVINPEYSTAHEIFRLLQFPSFLKRDSFAKGRVEIVEVELREGSPLVGATLAELTKKVKVKVLVCAVERGNEVFIPDGNFRLKPGDRLSFTASSSDLAKLIRNLGLTQKKVKDVMIIGGSRIAFYLAENLLRTGANVKLLEIDETRCQELAELLPKATIIHADGSDKNILDSEGLAQADAVVTLTDIDEENLIVSMYANYLGTFKVITKINRTEYTEVLGGKGIDCVVSPKDLCCHDIVRYVRAMGNRKGESALTLHRIVGDKVEALEFQANKQLPQLGKRLADIKLYPNTLIACLTRKGRIIIPQGSDTIEKDDTVIVVVNSDRIINNLSDIFLED